MKNLGKEEKTKKRGGVVYYSIGKFFKKSYLERRCKK